MSQLPPEIVLHILEIGCDEEYKRNSKVKGVRAREPSASLNPFARSPFLTCKAWNRLIQSTSTLWFATVVLALGRNPEHAEEIFCKSEGILAKHDSEDLDIYISLPKSGSKRTRSLELLEHQLLPKVSHWRTFCVHAFDNETLTLVWTKFQEFDSLPRLMDVSIHVYPPIPIPVVAKFPKTPKFQYATLTNMTWHQFQLRHLSDLTIEQGSAPPFTLATLTAPMKSSHDSLTSLNMQLGPLSSDKSSIDAPKPVTLSSLTSLGAHLESVIDFTRFIRLFHFQCLENLYLGTVDNEVADLLLPLSSPQIEFPKLHTVNLGIAAALIIPFLALLHLPALTSLSLIPLRDGQEGVATVLKVLHFPRLERLHAHWGFMMATVESFPQVLRYLDTRPVKHLTLFGDYTSVSSRISEENYPSPETLSIDEVSTLNIIAVPSLNTLTLCAEDFRIMRDKEYEPMLFQRYAKQVSKVQGFQWTVTRNHASKFLSEASSFFPLLESLTLQYGEAESLLENASESLAVLLDEDTYPPANRLVFGSITSLDLVLPRESDELPDGAIKVLKEIVLKRKAVGAPLLHLGLSKLPESPSLVSWFEREVEEFCVTSKKIDGS